MELAASKHRKMKCKSVWAASWRCWRELEARLLRVKSPNPPNPPNRSSGVVAFGCSKSWASLIRQGCQEIWGAKYSGRVVEAQACGFCRSTVLPPASMRDRLAKHWRAWRTGPHKPSNGRLPASSRPRNGSRSPVRAQQLFFVPRHGCLGAWIAQSTLAAPEAASAPVNN